MSKRFKNQVFFPLPQIFNRHWYKKLFAISILGLYGVLNFSTISKAVPPNAQLQDWRFFPEVGQLEFTLSAASQPKYFFLSQPARLVVDIPGTKLGYVPTQQNFSGAIQRIRLSQLNANVTRIVMDLAPGTAFNPNQVLLQPFSPTRWILRPWTTGMGSTGYLQQQYNQVPTIYPPQPFNPTSPGTPPGAPPGNYNSQFLNTLPQGIYNPQIPNTLPQGTYNPQLPNTLPPGSYNPPTSGLLAPPNRTTLPSTGNIQPQPFISVPPLAPNPSQLPGSILPPANFQNPSGGINNPPLLISPNVVVPTSPNNPNNFGGGVVPWGQSLPNQR
jgi:AMIN domain